MVYFIPRERGIGIDDFIAPQFRTPTQLIFMSHLVSHLFIIICLPSYKNVLIIINYNKEIKFVLVKPNATNVEQLVSLLKSHESELARICMVNNRLAGPCTDNVGIANSVGALW